MQVDSTRNDSALKIRVLIVDDCEATRKALASFLKKHGIETVETAGAGDAIKAMETARPHFVLTDYLLGDGDGIGLAGEIRALSSNVVIYLITGWQLGDEVTNADRDAIRRFIQKPVSPNELVPMLREDFAGMCG